MGKKGHRSLDTAWRGLGDPGAKIDGKPAIYVDGKPAIWINGKPAIYLMNGSDVRGWLGNWVLRDFADFAGKV